MVYNRQVIIEPVPLFINSDGIALFGVGINHHTASLVSKTICRARGRQRQRHSPPFERPAAQAILDAVRAYSAHEKATFEHIAELRNLSRSTEQLSRRQDGENSLTDGLKRLFALAEAYPQLKADRNFLDLQQQLTEVEDALQMARRYYNGAVRDYNIQVESFPSNCVARLFGFGREEFFQIVTTSEHRAPVLETD